MHGTRNLSGWKQLALALALSATSITALAEPTHGSFPYGWRHRGAFAPQTMWFGHYPTRWRQWPGQEAQELSPTASPVEELPSPDEDSSGAPKPPEDATLPRPGATTPTPAEEPPIVPPLELPGTAPGNPMDFDPTNPLPIPSGNDPIPPLLPPERTPPPGLEPSGASPPGLEPDGTSPSPAPSTEPSALPPLEGTPPAETSPATPPLESPGTPESAPPSTPEGTPSSEPTPNEPIPPLDVPRANLDSPLQPTADASESILDSSVEADATGPRLGAALPVRRPTASGPGSVSLGWVAKQAPAPEPTRFVPATGIRQLPPRTAATRSSEGVEQVAAVEVGRRATAANAPPERSATRRGNPLRDGGSDSATTNPLRTASGGR